jgi:hypothetical protein
MHDLVVVLVEETDYFVHDEPPKIVPTALVLLIDGQPALSYSSRDHTMISENTSMIILHL